MIKNFRISFKNDPEIRIHMQGDFPEESKLKRLSYFMSLSEFENFAAGGYSGSDCNMRMETLGHRVSCYYMDLYQSQAFGTMEVPFVHLDFPVFARKILLKYLKKVTGTGVIELSQKRLDKWVKNYGERTGKVEIMIADPKVKEKLEQNLSDTQFVQNFERLKTIALNSTHTFFQTAVLRLYNDSCGFGWEAMTPKHKTILWGGLIKHSDNTWGVHT